MTKQSIIGKTIKEKGEKSLSSQKTVKSQRVLERKKWSIK